MEGKRNHGFNLIQMNADHAVVICPLVGKQAPVILRSSVGGQICACRVIRFPDRGKAPGFGRHHIHTAAKIHGQRGNAGTCKLQNTVAYKAGGKNRSDQCDRHIMRSDSRFRLAGQIDQCGFGCFDVVGAAQKLFDKLRSAFADSHGANGAVPRMRIGTENHFPTPRQHFTRKRMNHRLICRYINTAVFFCRRKSEYMIIFIDGSSDRTQGIVAIGQRIGNRKRRHTACPCRLDNTYIGNVMRYQCIKAQMQIFSLVCAIVTA
ncbi:unknown [Clostridium sp. CAG:448]|nr:unknown [Clostridium sp. CAG:448]